MSLFYDNPLSSTFINYDQNINAFVNTMNAAGVYFNDKVTNDLIKKLINGETTNFLYLIVNTNNKNTTDKIYAFKKIVNDSECTENNALVVYGWDKHDANIWGEYYDCLSSTNAKSVDDTVLQYYYQQGTGISWFKRKFMYHNRDKNWGSSGDYQKEEKEVYLWVPYNALGNSKKITFSSYNSYTADGVNVGNIDLVNNTITSVEKNTIPDPEPEPIPDNDDEDTENNGPKLTTTATDDYTQDDFADSFYSEESEYYNDLYGWKDEAYSAKSFDSIIGMPIQFMGNVDMRFGSSTFGRQYTEDILYDAPICTIQPGAPALGDSTMTEGESESFKKLLDGIAATYQWGSAIINGGGQDALKTWLTEWLVGSGNSEIGDSYGRFYGFQSQYARYVQYVNTLCHLFATFLGISEDMMPDGSKKYKYYDDTIEEVEKLDNGLGLKMRYGNYPAMFIYYQPDSSISQSFSNQTQESSLASKLNEVSNYSKEFSFLAGGLGFPGKGVTVGTEVDENALFGLASTPLAFGSKNILSRIFSRASEGVATIIGGNNLSFPEIYHDSNMSGTSYQLNIKLVNPYGTPEAAFLFQMRQLARLLAISLPRQYGPNGYTAPFILRAFSKGHFNVQLGIVEQLTINRAGSGAENQTVHDIPMELEISMTIKDLYQQIAISNEYTNAYAGTPTEIISSLSNIRQLKLLFNNTGLLDFVASFAGYNMNQPAIDMKLDFILTSMYSNLTDIVDFNKTWNWREWKFPRWNRRILDSFHNAVEQKTWW